MELEAEWDKGKDNNFVLVNPSVTALIIVLGDIVDHMVTQNKFKQSTISANNLK